MLKTVSKETMETAEIQTTPPVVWCPRSEGCLGGADDGFLSYPQEFSRSLKKEEKQKIAEGGNRTRFGPVITRGESRAQPLDYRILYGKMHTFDVFTMKTAEIRKTRCTIALPGPELPIWR